MAHPHLNHIIVPYSSRLLSELQPGQTLLVQGNILQEAKRFEINLLSECFEAGEWEKEERHSNPFKKGETFDIRIRVHEERFELLANQHHLADFKHRHAFTKIDHMQITGDITLSNVHWGGRYFEIPFQSTFHGHALKNGQRVFVYSIAKGDFSVNFVGANGDFLFHLNPRFGEKQIIRGSQKNGTWGEEEREGKFPLKKGEAVDIAIHNEPFSIQVFINGSHYCSFAHRVEDPNNEYKFLRVEGDIELTGVEVSH
uniref:Galectin n=1 Tax=Meloidogyne javanica TaxID=6303 RepID=A0A915MVW7_MELJA